MRYLITGSKLYSQIALDQNGGGSGIAMERIQATNGSDFAVAEKAHAGLVAQSLGERHSVLVLLPEKPRPPPETGK